MKRAFTLIELLVVIAIIAILAAILFPVFAQAKMAAKKTQTLSNMKQSSLGLIMYCGDVDDIFPMAEIGDNDNNHPHLTWTTFIYPYVKNGDQAVDSHNQKVSTGKDGIFKDVAAPQVSQTDAATEGYYFGVNRLICPANYDAGQPWYDSQGQVIPAMSQTEIDAPADKVLVATKGLNNPSAKWNYPWICDWESQYIDTVNPVNGVPTRDGDTTFVPGTPGYSPWYDTDGQNGVSEGKWETAAHPRYRYNKVAVFGFSDGHTKAIARGGLKWYQNIYVKRGGISGASWTYGWYYPSEPY